MHGQNHIENNNVLTAGQTTGFSRKRRNLFPGVSLANGTQPRQSRSFRQVRKQT